MAQVLKTDQIARAHVLMHLNTWDKGFSDRLDQLFAAHREAERERCAKIVNDTLASHEPLVPDEACRVQLVCDRILTALSDTTP
jgi:hypothetical protein